MPHNLVTEPNLASPNPDQIEFINNEPRYDDPDSRSTWSQRAWVASGCITVLFSLAKFIAGAVGSQIWLEPILAVLAGYILADLASGVYHWAIDNYGDATTPIVGAHIESFLKHHKWPSIITKCQFANLNYPLGRGITLTVLPISLVVDDPTLMALVGSLSGWIMFGLQFHAWAHTTKSKLPKIVGVLQDVGVLVSPLHHAAHHRPQNNSSYCMVSGIWNRLLDDNKVFGKLEMLVFSQLGVKPRSWSEPSSEWTEESSTTPSSLVVPQ